MSSKTLDLSKLKPGQVVQALRFGDQKDKAILIKKGLERDAWTQKEVAEWLGKTDGAISKLLKNYANK